MNADKKLTVRLPAEVLEQLKERALKGRRSLNSEIVFALEKHVSEAIRKREAK